MERTIDFIERLRARLGGLSDYKLGVALGVKTTTITNYSKRGRTMDDKMAKKVADIIGEDPKYVIACCHAQRAENDELTTLWEQIAAKLKEPILTALPAMLLITGLF